VYKTGQRYKMPLVRLANQYKLNGFGGQKHHFTLCRMAW